MKKIIVILILGSSLSWAQNSINNTNALKLNDNAEIKPRQFQISFKNEIVAAIDNYNHTGGADNYDYIKATYLVGDIKFGVLGSASSHIPGKNEAEKQTNWVLGDIATSTEISSAGILGSDKLSFESRVYFPTSEPTRKLNEKFNLVLIFNLPYTLNGIYSSNIYFRPQYTFRENQNNKLSLFTQAQLQANLNAWFSPYIALNHRLIKDGIASNSGNETLGPELGTDFTFTKAIQISLGIYQDRIIDHPADANAEPKFALFNPKESSYYFEFKIKF